MGSLFPTASYTSVSVHGYSNLVYVCGVTTSGEMWCFEDHPGTLSLRRVGPDLSFESVTASMSAVCGIRTDGKVWCRGSLFRPPAVEQVQALGNSTCHVDRWGYLSCFGDGYDIPFLAEIFGLVGGGWESLALSHQQVCGLQSGTMLTCYDRPFYPSSSKHGVFASIHGGSEDNVCGLRWDGEIECWTARYDSWEAPAGPFAQLDVGRDHACAVRDDGSVACWGDDTEGEATPPSGSFVSVSAGTDGTCGLQLDGTAICWGDVEGDAPPTYFDTVEVGAGWACGIRPDGTVQCWGANADGQAEPPGDAFVSLTTGDAHTCGVLRAGGFVCWGDDSDGQLAP